MYWRNFWMTTVGFLLLLVIPVGFWFIETVVPEYWKEFWALIICAVLGLVILFLATWRRKK